MSNGSGAVTAAAAAIEQTPLPYFPTSSDRIPARKKWNENHFSQRNNNHIFRLSICSSMDAGVSAVSIAHRIETRIEYNQNRMHSNGVFFPPSSMFQIVHFPDLAVPAKSNKRRLNGSAK